MTASCTYLGVYGSSPKTDALLDEVHRVEVIVTDSVVEALALENHLIKQRSPKYNILLRDDKNYPYLKLTTGEEFPRILVARRVERDAHFYAGPFLPATFARKTMALTHRLFGLRSCNEVITGKRGRPCLEYDIKRCIAPCVDALCTAERYARAVTDTKLFLEGRREELARELEDRMRAAAEGQRYEEAAQLRDAMRTVTTLHERQQKMATARLGRSRCVWCEDWPRRRSDHGLRHARWPRHRASGARDRRRGRRPPTAKPSCCRRPCSSSTSSTRYRRKSICPSSRRTVKRSRRGSVRASGRTVRLLVPKRGDKRGLIELATRNAALAYETRFNEDTVANYDALETLRVVLQLPSVPRRIECFDISTIQGSETVASMVVCEDGRMRTGEYRKYRILGLPALTGGRRRRVAPSAVQPEAPAPDDFAAMHEVVLRRFRRLLEQGGPFPDLIVIDGGHGPADGRLSGA